MSAIKANQYLQSLDAARCNGEWDQVPELCRKVQKHAPGRRCLALTALTEAKVLQLHAPPLGISDPAAAPYVTSLNALQHALEAEVPPAPASGSNQTATEEDILQARVTIAWVSGLKGDWRNVLDVVPGEDEVGEGWVGGPVKSEYMDTARLKALVLKGQALSHMNNDLSLPLQVYRAATRLHTSLIPASRNSISFTTWAEKALALYALATYKIWLDGHMPPGTLDANAGPLFQTHNDQPTPNVSMEDTPVGVAIGKTIVDESAVASAFRSFHKFASTTVVPNRELVPTGLPRPISAGQTVSSEKDATRKELYRFYYKFLSLILLPPNHPNRPLADPLAPAQTAGAENAPLSVRPELQRKHSASKVGTSEQLREENKAIALVYEEYLLKNLKFPKAEEYHEVIGEWVDQVVENWRLSGGTAEDVAPVVQILYRASTKSFHSPRVLRHLFYTLTATGNLQDGLAALTTYIDLVQGAMDRISKGNHEKDFDRDVIIFQTAVEGIRILCKFAPSGEKAMAIATKMEKWVEMWHIKDKDILGEVYRGIGMANAAFARLTPEGELRPDALKAAADAFRKGLGYDPIDAQGWYGLALVEAEMRDIDRAMESARKGLGALKYHFVDNEDPDDVEGSARDYKRFAIPLMHLLALLMTAKEDFENAEKVCKSAFEIVGEGRGAVSDLGVTDKLAIFELMMTQLAIVETVEDADSAVTMAERLLGLYGMLFDGTHLVQRLEVGNSEDNLANNTYSARPATTASKRSRLFSRGHKKQFSASYSNLPPPIPEPLPTYGATIKKRPKSGHQPGAAMTGQTGQSTIPNIHVTDSRGGSSASPADNRLHRKSFRASSLTGGTVRKMKSLGSLRLKREPQLHEPPPTPPLPSSTEASSLNFDSPVGSIREGGKDPHLFHSLKSKLHHHHHHHSHDVPSATGSVASIVSPAEPPAVAHNDGVHSKRESAMAEDVPNNLPQNRLPYPLSALGRTLSDDGQTKVRTVRRPIQLPEPKLAVEEEQKQVLGALRKAWICVAGLYRRAGFFSDALMATDEANGLVGKEGEGEADVLAERGFLAYSQGLLSVATEHFEQAIAIDYDHPQAIMGLCKLLLNVTDKDLNPEIVLSSGSRPSSRGTNATTDTIEDKEFFLNQLASRNRALGLLEKLIVSPRGWDLPDGWFLLADALEKGGEIDRARSAFWRVVELEDGTGVRGWGTACGCGVI